MPCVPRESEASRAATTEPMLLAAEAVPVAPAAAPILVAAVNEYTTAARVSQGHDPNARPEHAVGAQANGQRTHTSARVTLGIRYILEQGDDDGEQEHETNGENNCWGDNQLGRANGVLHVVEESQLTARARTTKMHPAASTGDLFHRMNGSSIEYTMPSIKLTTNVARRGGELAATPMARPASAHPTMMLVALCTDISPEAKGR
eukprot:CAMPEP_0202421498 /NCGR_PEP_ID=MMETSP1128-20130828/50369_1 /ASSEMBLY_ACC=CAM_ASM_000463 /TAXON_ID=3047 /ORGANISM="Dunaliella tertiolecta, Strain CCMP1320" /LENGTH=204 /DNA_ID=CAMNT_0049029521 /DNA_START=1456 /DNA_END=2070 /DNA_ORIENTATION=+